MRAIAAAMAIAIGAIGCAIFKDPPPGERGLCPEPYGWQGGACVPVYAKLKDAGSE